MNTGGKISVLRRAVGEPNVETEWEPSRQLEILEPPLAVDDPPLVDGPPLWGETSEERSGGVRREVLRYTQEMPLLEQIFASLAARRLRQSGQEGGSYSLDEVNHVLSELMAQAIAQQEEERVQRLLQMQDQFDGLPFLLGASSLRHSTAEIRVARPASDVLRRSLSGSSSSGLPSSPFSSSSSIPPSPFPSAQTPSAPEDLDLQLPCLICFDAFASSAMKSLDTCDLHKYCAECLGSHLAAQINESLIGKLCCPDPDCTSMATENDVAALVPPEVHERYLLFTVFAFLKHENTFYCPNTACLSPIYPPEGTCGEAPRSHACPACNTRFCALCSRHEHLGTDCQGQDSSLSDWASSRPVDSVKPCPGCRTLVEKNSGCNHITCKCLFQWCWLCQDQYISDHFAAPSICKEQQFAPFNDLLAAVEHRVRNEISGEAKIHLRSLSCIHKAEYHNWCHQNPATIRQPRMRKLTRTPEQKAFAQEMLARHAREEELVYTNLPGFTETLSRDLAQAREHLALIQQRNQERWDQRSQPSSSSS